MIRPVNFDFNFIEVRPEGWFFNIEKKCFVRNPTELKDSPRAFVLYVFNGVVPRPKPFIEGISCLIPKQLHSTETLFYKRLF